MTSDVQQPVSVLTIFHRCKQEAWQSILPVLSNTGVLITQAAQPGRAFMQPLSGAFDVAFTVVKRAEVVITLPASTCRGWITAACLISNLETTARHSLVLLTFTHASYASIVTVHSADHTISIVSTRDNLRKQSCAEHLVSYPNRINLDCSLLRL